MALTIDLWPNPDFDCLVETRRRVCKELDLREKQVELSIYIGVSADCEQAESTNIREAIDSTV